MHLRNVAVVGFSHAPIVECDEHRIATEMLYPQIREALESCGVSRDEIDFQVAGSSDYIDGRPFGFTAALDVMGSWPPREDSHLEMDAAFAAFYGWLKIQAGECDSVMVVGYGKVSEGEPDRILNLQLDPFYLAPLGLDPTSTAALQASAYLHARGIGERELAEVAARNREAGARNPGAQLREAASPDALLATDYVVEPLRRGFLPPKGESAVCLLMAAEGKAERMCERPAWIHGVDTRSELQSLGSRDLTRSEGARLAAERALAMAGLTDARQVDVVELLAGTPVEEMILLEALGLPPRGGGGPVINPSGGALCGHPIMQTGLIRLGECFLQISGRAGSHQVDGATRAIAHAAQGHCLQQNLVWVLGAERRWS